MSPRDRSRDSNRWLVPILAFSLISMISGLVAVTARMGPPAIAIWGIVLGGLAMLSRGPIGQAIAASIHPTQLDASESEAVIPPELYAELDELRARIGELEERQEFSERLLSNRNEAKDGQ